MLGKNPTDSKDYGGKAGTIPRAGCIFAIGSGPGCLTSLDPREPRCQDILANRATLQCNSVGETDQKKQEKHYKSSEEGTEWERDPGKRKCSLYFSHLQSHSESLASISVHQEVPPTTFRKLWVQS